MRCPWGINAGWAEPSARAGQGLTVTAPGGAGLRGTFLLSSSYLMLEMLLFPTNCRPCRDTVGNNFLSGASLIVPCLYSVSTWCLPVRDPARR